jgi:hypothetical protein
MSPNRHAARFFFVLAVVGLLLPWRYNLQYVAAGGSVAPDVFWRDAFANALTAAITLDVYLAAAAFSVAVALDAPAGPRRWWAIPATFLIGLSFALPGYLGWRLRGQRAAD